MAQKHICGPGGEEFNSNQAYLNHTCSETGKKPTNPEHLGRIFALVSEKAVARGNAKKPKVV